MRALLTILLCLGIAATAADAAPRSKSARAAFQRMNPCPANGATRGACPGYVADHVVPLCAGGEDAPSNMQWQTIENGKVKDRAEHRQCAAYRRSRQ